MITGDRDANEEKPFDGPKFTRDHTCLSRTAFGTRPEHELARHGSKYPNNVEYSSKRNGAFTIAGGRCPRDPEDLRAAEHSLEKATKSSKDNGPGHAKADHNDIAGVGADGLDGTGENSCRKTVV